MESFDSKIKFSILALSGIILEQPDGAYKFGIDVEINYNLLPYNDKRIRFLLNHFDIPSKKSLKCNRIISTIKNFLGKWTWAFGNSTNDAPSY